MPQDETDAATTIATGMAPDAPSRTVSTTTSASPAQLWPLLVDPSTPAAFSDEFQRATWTPTEGAEPPGLGARFVGHNQSERMGEWTTLATVTTHDPPRRHGWTVHELDDPISDWTFEVEPTGTGTVLRFTCRLGTSPLSGLTRAIRKYPDRAEEFTTGRLDALAANMQRTVEGIAALAEAAGEEGA